jgi:hypothetical protein
MEGKRRYAIHLAKPSDAKDIVDFLNACGNLTLLHFHFFAVSSQNRTKFPVNSWTFYACTLK